MRPYLAIIKDSFRAALSSSVLYVLLALITILLLAVAPFHYQETLDWKIDAEKNFTAPTLVFERLVDRHDEEGEEVVKHLWERLPASLQKDLTSFMVEFRAAESETDETGEGGPEDAEPDDSEDQSAEKPKVEVQVGGNRRRRQQQNNDRFFRELRLSAELAESLNEIIQTSDFYDETVWASRPLNNEAKELVDAGVKTLTEERMRRLNRLLVEQAVSPTIKSGSPTSLDFYYTPWKQIEFLTSNQTHSQFKSTFSSQIPYYFDKFVLSIGLIIAILVTANMIPETFEPGSLNLLLSKPIYRWALLVAKFVGGCAFVALCAGYLFIGIWLWFGFGLGIWDRAILLSIPLYILVFAIYYSVSTFFGVWFRSPIVSVILTALFWLFCFSIGTIYGFVHTYMHNSELIHPVALGDKVVSVDPVHQFYGWDANGKKWVDRMVRGDNPEEQVAAGFLKFAGKMDQMPEPVLPPTIGPILDPVSNQVLLGSIKFGDQESMQRRAFSMLDGETQVTQTIGKFPTGTIDIVLDDQGPILVDSGGRFRRMDVEKAKQATAKSSDVTPKKTSDEASVTDQEMASKPKRKPKRLSPNDWLETIGPKKKHLIRGPNYVAANATRNEIVVLHQLRVYVYARNSEGEYELDRQVDLDVDLPSSMSTSVEYQGNTIFVVLGNGQIITLDAKTLEEMQGYQPESRSAYRSLAASSDGRWFAVVYNNGNLWMLDTQDPENMFRPSVKGQGGISGVSFADQSVWVCDRTDRMTKYGLDSFSQEVQLLPPSDMMSSPFRFSYRFIIDPFYKICPKPGEFYKLVSHLSSSSDAKSNTQVDLRLVNEESSPWSPLWSGLGFMCMMLFFSCLMFHFSDY